MIRRLLPIFLVIGLIGSGCRTKSAIAIVTGAPDALAKKGSAKMEMTMSFAGNLGGQDFDFDVKGEGVFGFADQRGRMSFSFPSTELPGLGGKQEMVFDKSLVYLRVSDCPAGGLGGKAWVRYDYRKAAGVDPNSATNSDPTNFLETLRGAGEIEEIGKEKVRGVPTTHYKVDIDLEKALQNLTEERREQVKAAFEAIGKTKTTADVWIDDDDLPRKYEIVFGAGGQQSGSFEVTMILEFFDYGTKEDVTVPSDDQVQDVDGPQAVVALCSPVPTQPSRAPGY